MLIARIENSRFGTVDSGDPYESQTWDRRLIIWWQCLHYPLSTTCTRV